jgi:sugar O-acyltransferase (sialic acid O-acetyltransferase NeuD family)
MADVEESLFRAEIEIQAAVQNQPGESFLSIQTRVLTPDAVPPPLKELPFLVPLFTPGNRQAAACEAMRLGFRQPFSLIDPSVAAPRSLQYQPGLYINTGSCLGGACEFDAFVFINRGAAIGHHARFGAFVSIGPGAVIAGQVTIGKGAVVGAAAVVLPQIRIGENAVVGAGAVVTRDVPDHSMVFGNPARIIKTGISGYNGKSVP